MKDSDKLIEFSGEGESFDVPIPNKATVTVDEWVRTFLDGLVFKSSYLLYIKKPVKHSLRFVRSIWRRNKSVVINLLEPEEDTKMFFSGSIPFSNKCTEEEKELMKLRKENQL